MLFLGRDMVPSNTGRNRISQVAGLHRNGWQFIAGIGGMISPDSARFLPVIPVKKVNF